MLKSATAIIKRFFITCPPSFKNLTTFNIRETFAVPVASSLPISRLLFIINVHSVTCFKCFTVALNFHIILYFLLYSIYLFALSTNRRIYTILNESFQFINCFTFSLCQVKQVVKTRIGAITRISDLPDFIYFFLQSIIEET